MNSSCLVIKQKQKQTNKQKILSEDWVSKLNCKIECFVPNKGYQNCLNKSLLSPTFLNTGITGETFQQSFLNLFKPQFLLKFILRGRYSGSHYG